MDEAIRKAANEDRAVLDQGLMTLRAPFGDGARVLLAAVPGKKAIREETTSVWLGRYRGHLTARLGLLRLIATIAPMLGLLGTVIGMVIAFREIAGHAGPVGPAVLADGLWQAMLTTVIGLAVALPATIAASLLRALADNRIERLANSLTRLSLSLEARHDAVGSRELAA